MKKSYFLITLCTLSAFAMDAVAQNELKTLPDKRERLRRTTRILALTTQEIQKFSSGNKPTGDKQRLIKTIGEAGTPGGTFYRNYEKFFLYSGNNASITPIHGPYPVSNFDSMYCTTNESYGYQRFYPSGNLLRSLYFADYSFSSGPGASRTDVKDYDEAGRLTLDSFFQAGQPGFNLSMKDRYSYDNYNRLSFTSFAIEGYDPGSYDYVSSTWKHYTDTLPNADSLIIIDNNIVTIKQIKHYYDNNHLLITDSVRINNSAAIKEIVVYTYPETGKQIGQTMVLENGIWKPYSRHIYGKDNLGRMKTDQMELYENNEWHKYYRNDKQYTFDTQPDSLPTVFSIYNIENNNWFVDAQEVRTFNENGLTDTVYFYAGNGVPNDMYNYERQVFKYNAHGNLTQDYCHFYLKETGQEINGYYVNYFYEDVLSVKDLKSKEDGLVVFPNPATGQITVRFDNWPGEPREIRITDVAGNCMVKANMRSREYSLDLGTLKSGTYFIQIVNTDNNSKVVKTFAKM
ncbi:MAG: T9SS type A sorting domain-containing protein [Taibaiella sp.]|jgi:hypothetical protein